MASLFRRLAVTAPASVPVRHQSTTRRLTKALKLHPHPSMKLLSDAPRADHIIYNPPSAAPNPLITPSIFLPKDDPRRAMAPPETKPAPERLPPAVRKPYEKSYHLTPTDFKEIRRLRKMNPEKYTRVVLAKMFNTSNAFIGMVCESSKEHQEKMEERLEKQKNRWGMKRRIAREERIKRRMGWGGRDGL